MNYVDARRPTVFFDCVVQRESPAQQRIAAAGQTKHDERAGLGGGGDRRTPQPQAVGVVAHPLVEQPGPDPTVDADACAPAHAPPFSTDAARAPPATAAIFCRVFSSGNE